MYTEFPFGNTNPETSSGVLDGVVVADFTRILAGPYCTMLLADMGATVIKIEAPRGDDSREWLPPQRDGVSSFYLSVNRNKQSIVLDLRDAKDLEIAYEIINRSDVFIENFKPGGLKKFGLDPETVARRWPHVVHASITGFGSKGGSHMPGYDLLVQALSGFMTVTGDSEGDPQRAGVAVFDVITGLHAAIGVLGAIYEKSRSNQGQHVEFDLLSSAISGLVNLTGGYASTGHVPHRMGNEHPSIFPYGPFQTADREIIIACGNDAQYARLVDALGAKKLADDGRFRTMEDRNANRAVLKQLLENRLQTRTADEWFDILQEIQVPCSPILKVNEGIDFAEKLGLNPVVTAGSETEGIPTIKHPATFSRSQVVYDQAPPNLNEHRRDVLRWISETNPRCSSKLLSEELNTPTARV